MFKFRKIASVLASSVMVTSTVALAAASMYPQPFVSSSGSPNVLLVTGSNAPGTVDLAAATNIMTNLNTFVVSGSTGNSGGSVIEGADSVLIAKSSDNLNLADTWSSVFTGTVDDDDMPTLLADGTYSADDNDDFDYEQKITLGAGNLTHFRDSDYEDMAGLDDRTPVVGFKLSSSQFVMNYTLDFTDDAESDVASGDLEDFEGSDLPLFGKTYYISDAQNGSSSTYLGKFTLLDSAATAIVSDGETVTVTVGDTSYDVSLNFASTSAAKLNINGEITNSLAVGQTFKLSDGSFVGVREINVNDYAGGTKNVEFSIGTGKLEIESGQDIELNDEAVQGVKGYVYRGTGTSGSEKIDKIIINWVTDEESFLTPETEVVMPGFESLKFTMADLVRAEEEVVKIEKDGDNSIQLTAPIKDGTVSFNILYNSATTGNFTGIGKDGDELLATSNTTELIYVDKTAGSDYHDWFVASFASSSDSESYLLRATSFVEGTTSNGGKNKTTIQRNEDGTWTDVCKDKSANDDCSIGDVSLTINSVAYSAGGATKSVNMTAGSGVSFHELYTAGGLKIYLPYIGGDSAGSNSGLGGANFTAAPANASAGHNRDTFYLYMDGENKDEDVAGGSQFYFTIDNTADFNLQVSQVNGAGSGGANGLEIGDSSTYEAYIVDDVAPRILHYTNPDEDWAEVYYPGGTDSETYAEAFLTSSDATLSGNGGTGGAVPAPILDTEIGSAAGKNLIVVGGSCVNTVAAQLLDSSVPLCGADFTAKTGVGSGSFLIETFERADKVATLVAGYNAGDTTNAATAFTTQDIDTTVGKKYTGTTATSVTLDTSMEA